MPNRFILLLATLITMTSNVIAQDFMLTREANIMSDSDEISLTRMPYFSSSRCGKGLLWDFTESSTSKRHFNIWHQVDTVGRHLQLTDRDITYYQNAKDTLLIVSKESPLYKITYNRPILAMHYPFAYGDSLSAPFSGYGVYCGDHPFKEQGMSTIMSDAEGDAVIGEDTIHNVLRVYTLRSYSICMDIDSAALDSARLKQIIKERYDWYARGYRYPIVTTVTSTSYDNMTPLGTKQTAYCLLPDIQSQFADSVNEDIRRKDSLAAAEQARANTDIIHYTVSQSGGLVTIDYSLDSDADITALVSDAMGIVYRRTHVHNQSGTGYNLTLDCSGLRRGQYILYINVNGKVYSNEVAL